MKLKGTEPGLVLSGVAHAAMLAAALVSFSETRPLTDATETIPVEMITDSALNEIMQGVKTAQEKTPQPPIADKVAEIIETRPKPVVNEAKVDVATAPPPAPPRPEPGQDDAPAPVPPQQVAALPPKPEPPTPPSAPPRAAPSTRPPRLARPTPTPRACRHPCGARSTAFCRSNTSAAGASCRRRGWRRATCRSWRSIIWPTGRSRVSPNCAIRRPIPA